MKWTKVFPDGKGGYNVFDNWSLTDDILSKLFPLLLLIPTIALFGLILPAFFWLTITMHYRKDNIINMYVSIGTSVLFFLDYRLGGLLWCFSHSTEMESILDFFAILHLLFLIGNVIRFNYYKSGIEVLPFFLFAPLIFIMYFGYDMLNAIVKTMCSSTPMSWFAEMFYEHLANYKARHYY